MWILKNVTPTHRDAYSRLVQILRENLPREKKCPWRWPPILTDGLPAGTVPMDYAALAEYADYLMIMAYDESWQGSDPGPVASATFAERSIAYALQYAPPEKLVLGVPFYGRLWSEDGQFNGNGVSIKTLEKMLTDYNAKITYSETDQSPKAEFTVREGDKAYTINGKQLSPGNYTVWFENEQSIEAKIQLIHKYNLKGLGSWSLTQATDADSAAALRVAAGRRNRSVAYW